MSKFYRFSCVCLSFLTVFKIPSFSKIIILFSIPGLSLPVLLTISFLPNCFCEGCARYSDNIIIFSNRYKFNRYPVLLLNIYLFYYYSYMNVIQKNQNIAKRYNSVLEKNAIIKEIVLLTIKFIHKSGWFCEKCTEELISNELVEEGNN